MRRVFVVCLGSAALFLGSTAFVVGSTGIASAAPSRAASISLSGTWEVQIGSTTSESIKFQTSKGTFKEDDTHGFGDHGTYSLTGKKLKLRWTGGTSEGLSFAGKYKSAKHEFVGTYTNSVGETAKGDLLRGS
jgi:hypothetical protein